MVNKISGNKEICGIEGCSNIAERSLSSVKIATALTKEGLKTKPSRKTKVKLCRDHYRLIRRHIKKDRRIDSLRY